jgi:hypothetical protein
MISLRVVQLGEATHSAFLQLAAEAREHSRTAARADYLDEPADMLVRLFIDMPWAGTSTHTARAQGTCLGPYLFDVLWPRSSSYRLCIPGTLLHTRVPQ